jgi:hypothetical protein
MRSTHAARLERWVGPAELERISAAVRDWYGPPIPVGNVPGAVYATRGGDFVGRIRGGGFASMADFATQRIDRILRNASRAQVGRMHAGFASLSDLIAEATTGGKKQIHPFNQAGTVAAAAPQPMSLWNVGAKPLAGGVGGTRGTGRACTRTTVGALGQANAGASDQLHLTLMGACATVPNTLLLYDRLWDQTWNHATGTTQAIDSANRPTRYQTAALAPGNFASGEVTTALSATAHNITLTYVDDAGNTAEAAAAYAAPVSAAANRIPLVSPNWFLTLNAGDTGLRYFTNFAQSTITSVTGVSNFFIGHPLAFVPCPVANIMFLLDGINSAFNLERVFDDACLCFLELPKTATTATTYNGFVSMVSG